MSSDKCAFAWSRSPLRSKCRAARTLVSALSGHGVEFPCGGTGLCGGCGVRVLSGSLPVTDADRAAFSTEAA